MKDYMLIIAVCVVFLGLFLGAWIVASKFEADAYNRITGAHVTTWDAMWIELRVQEKPQ